MMAPGKNKTSNLSESTEHLPADYFDSEISEHNDGNFGDCSGR